MGRNDRDLVKEISKKPNEQKESKKAPTPEENQLSDQTEVMKKRNKKYNKKLKRSLRNKVKKTWSWTPTTMFTHKVDGQDVNVDLQELLNNYSGKVSYDQKFQELAEKKKICKQEYAYDNELEDQYEHYMGRI